MNGLLLFESLPLRHALPPQQPPPSCAPAAAAIDCVPSERWPNHLHCHLRLDTAACKDACEKMRLYSASGRRSRRSGPRRRGRRRQARVAPHRLHDLLERSGELGRAHARHVRTRDRRQRLSCSEKLSTTRWLDGGLGPGDARASPLVTSTAMPAPPSPSFGPSRSTASTASTSGNDSTS